MSTSIDTGAAEVALAEVKAGETRSLHPRSVDETAVSAHHEAAHVVLAFRHGLRTPSVSIAPQEGSYGRTDCHFDSAPAEVMIKVVFAGFLAAARLNPNVPVRGFDSDAEIAFGIGAAIWGADAE